MKTRAALEKWRRGNKAGFGFVPTMGALHEGHLALVRRARKSHRRVLVSIFVNPTQFGPKEDLARYPRDLAGDRHLLGSVPGTTVFAPAVKEVYPDGFATDVHVGGALGSELEARWRPGHLDGVATVVGRLLGLVRPHSAYFGLKDYQQYLVVRRLNEDLALGVKIVGCPTVRERDGLALSSRNRYLGAHERHAALALSGALRATALAASKGEKSVARLEKIGLGILKVERGLKIQYFKLRGAEDFSSLKRLDRPSVALAACKLGKTRLIDNLKIGKH